MIYLLVIASCFSLFASTFSKVDLIVNEAIKAKTLPGASLVIGNKTSLKKVGSYGTTDSVGPHSVNVIYDVASLTKVLATSTSIMILVDQGKIQIKDKVSTYISSFSGGDKSLVTIEDLLRHEAGLLPGLNVLKDETFSDYLLRISATPLSYRPRSKVVYSDLSFILLGTIVEIVTGEKLGDFSQRAIFNPLGMNHTFFKVPEQLKPLCAPTMKDRFCLPHDPKAFSLYPYELGHAGVFSTIQDVARFAQMILNEGELDGVRILSRETVQAMQKLESPHTRGLGWDILSEYSNAPRGEVFPAGITFGHTGYTGTTLWIDPKSGSFYAFLSNRVFLGERNTAKPFSQLRRSISTEIGKTIYGHSFSIEERMR